MKFVRKVRGLRLGHDGNLDKLALPLWPDVGKALGLSRNHTYDAARSGEIPTVKFGRCLRVPLVALNKMLEDAGKPRPGKT
jgi:excisionase family DNA binding protein